MSLPSGGAGEIVSSITVEESRFDVDLVAFEIQVVDQREENSDVSLCATAA